MPFLAMPYIDARGYYSKNTNIPWPGNPSVTFSTVTNPNAIYRSDVKSALVRNARDGSGWRKPSAYSRTVDVRQEFYGDQLVWLSDNPTYDGWSRLTGFIGNTTYCPMLDTSYSNPESHIISRAEVECLLKLKNQNVNYAVALAEAHKASTMISGNLLKFANAYRFARAGRWKQAAGFLGLHKHTFKAPSKEFSKRWLEMQYGWLPLLSDIYGAYEDARKGLIDYNPRISVKRTIALPQPVPKPYVTKYGVRVFTEQQDSVYGVKVRLDYTLNSDALKTASKVGITNPAVVAWEVTPYSFLLDWVVPIGNWLDALDATFGLTFIGGTRTTFVKVNRKQTASAFTSKRGGNIVGSTLAEGFYNFMSMGRTVYVSSPIPTPYWKSPFSAVHAMNALALFRGFLK